MIKNIKYFIRFLINLTKLSVQLFKGQSVDYEVLQICHRIEKGLLIPNPRPRWGWDKIHRLISLESQDEFVKTLKESIISKYLNAKLSSGDSYDVEEAKRIISPDDKNRAGVLVLKKRDVLVDWEIGKQLFLTRHSIRDFSDKRIIKKDLEDAIALANRCPSACNRQLTKVYVVDGAERHRLCNSDVEGIYPPCFLLITGNINAFAKDEMYDWMVSSSIFAGYLSLSLHLKGIGSCCLRKPLWIESESMKEMREYFNIPEEEQIVLEMAIGYYKDEFTVAQSSRRSPNDILVLKN